MSGNDVQRRVRCARTVRAASVVVAAVLAVMATFVAARSLAAALAMAFPVAVLLMIAALETSGLRQWRAEERTRELSRHAGRLELAAKVLTAALAPSCSHPDAEPVDLLLAGERVAWVCPDCNAELPAGWTPAGQPSPPAVCECPDETRDTVWVHVPERATWVASYCAACGRGTGTITSAGSVQPSGMAALSGTGALSAKAAWDDVAYPSAASQHFAQLARVGRESCIGFCLMCAERDRRYRDAAEVATRSTTWEDVASMMQSMKDRWGQ